MLLAFNIALTRTDTRVKRLPTDVSRFHGKVYEGIEYRFGYFKCNESAEDKDTFFVVYAI